VFSCHRATLSGRFIPNSLAAVDECVGAGAPRLEIDVRFLADDAMLVFHDGLLDHETTASGRVDALDRAAASAVRYRQDERIGLCFLDDVVERMRGSETLLQVDLKLMRPISAPRARTLEAALAPISQHVLVGSQAHWNLRQLGGLPLAFDPTLQWHGHRGRHGNAVPRTLGRHGMWDDAPLASNPYATPEEYIHARVGDIIGLLPAATEWMVDIATIEHIAGLGVDLGSELARYGVSLAAWTLRETEPDPGGLLDRLFRGGVRTVITDVPLAAAAALR
jgi:glycerophosphoryl diester phosphodiesterase